MRLISGGEEPSFLAVRGRIHKYLPFGVGMKHFNVRKNQNSCVYGPPEWFEKRRTGTAHIGVGPIRKVVIVGQGALGLLYADRLNSLRPCDVTFVMDRDRYERHSAQKYTVNRCPVRFSMISSEQYPKDEPADLVIVATKATALDSALEVMECCVGEETVIMSVLNGISSEEIIAERFNEKSIVHCVAQGMDAVRIGSDLTYTKVGKLFIGPHSDLQNDAFKRVSEFLTEYGVEWERPADIIHHMWKKFMLNCGINQACMVYGGTYGTAVVPGTDIYNTFVGAMREVAALAASKNIAITEEDIRFYIDLMGTLNPDGMPSMAQDRINRRHSEVELFSGTVIKMADEMNVEVPINRWIYEQVKMIESEY